MRTYATFMTAGSPAVHSPDMGDATAGADIQQLGQQEDLSPLVASFVFSFDSGDGGVAAPSGGGLGRLSQPAAADTGGDAIEFLSVFDLDSQRHEDLLQLDSSYEHRPGFEDIGQDQDQDMLLKHYLMCLDRAAPNVGAPAVTPSGMPWRPHDPPPPPAPIPPPHYAPPQYADYHVSTTTLPECTERFHHHDDDIVDEDGDVVSSSVGLDHSMGSLKGVMVLVKCTK